MAAMSSHDAVSIPLVLKWDDDQGLDDADPGDATGELAYVADGSSQVVVGGLEPIERNEDHVLCCNGHREVLLHP